MNNAVSYGHGNCKIILDIECAQRKFTSHIAEIEKLNYKKRLKKLSIITLLECRMHGELIKTLKILIRDNF